MGQMKEMMMDMEEKVCDMAMCEADEYKNYAEFEEFVLNEYMAEPLLCWTDKDYIKEVASQMWFEELGNTL